MCRLWDVSMKEPHNNNNNDLNAFTCYILVSGKTLTKI